MAEAEVLAALKDIHLPEPPGFWPLAPGWYVLWVGILLFITLMLYLFHKKRLEARPKKQALALLKDYQKAYEQDQNAALASARISELLRRVALVYYPRIEVASLQGEQWIAFLNKSAKGIDFNPIQALLLELPFKNKAEVDLQPLMNGARLWIQQRGRPCSS